MSDASSIRKATTLPSATGTYASQLRFHKNEALVSTGSQWAPMGRVVLTPTIPSNGTGFVFVADRPYK